MRRIASAGVSVQAIPCDLGVQLGVVLEFDPELGIAVPDVRVFGIAFSWLRQPPSETKIFLRFSRRTKWTRADSGHTEVGAVRSSFAQRLRPYCLSLAPTELSLKPDGGQAVRFCQKIGVAQSGRAPRLGRGRQSCHSDQR